MKKLIITACILLNITANAQTDTAKRTLLSIASTSQGTANYVIRIDTNNTSVLYICSVGDTYKNDGSNFPVKSGAIFIRYKSKTVGYQTKDTTIILDSNKCIKTLLMAERIQMELMNRKNEK